MEKIAAAVIGFIWGYVGWLSVFQLTGALTANLTEGSRSFEIFVVVANYRQYWPRRADNAETPHWEHDFGAVGT